MPLAKAATQKAMSAAAGRSWYLVELRNRSRDRFDNLGPLRGERELCNRRASRSCSRVSYNFVSALRTASCGDVFWAAFLCHGTAQGRRVDAVAWIGVRTDCERQECSSVLP